MPETMRRIIHVEWDASTRRLSSATIPGGAPAGRVGGPRSRAAWWPRRLRGARLRACARPFRWPARCACAPSSSSGRPDFSRFRAVSQQVNGDPALLHPAREPLSLDEAYSTSPTISGANAREQCGEETQSAHSRTTESQRLSGRSRPTSSSPRCLRLEKTRRLTVIRARAGRGVPSRAAGRGALGVGPSPRKSCRANRIERLLDCRGGGRAAASRGGKSRRWLKSSRAARTRGRSSPTGGGNRSPTRHLRERPHGPRKSAARSERIARRTAEGLENRKLRARP